MNLSMLAARAITFYHKLDKFLLAVALLVPTMVTIVHVDYTLHNLSAQYHNLTVGGRLNRIIQDVAWSVVFPDKQECGPCPSVCNATLNMVVQAGGGVLVDTTNETYESVVIFASHP